jgi:drug/metabolite transporter (DMT)-like permease
MSDRNKGLGLLIIAVLIFGIFGILTKIISEHPLILLFSLQIMGVMAFFLISLRRGFSPLSSKGVVFLSFATLCILVSDFAIIAVLRLEVLPVADALFIKFTFPIFVVLFAPLMLREAVHKMTVYAVGIGLAGLLIILVQDFGFSYNWYGVSGAFVSAVFFALYLILLKKGLSHISVESFLFYRYAASSVILIPILWFSGNFPVIWSFQAIAPLVGFGLLFGVVGTLLHTEGIKRVKAQEASTLGYIEPLSATIYGMLILSEIPTLYVFAGGVLIIASGLIIIRNK